MRENQENWAMNLVELEMSNNKNDITGDKIITKHKSKTFDDNFDSIFRKPKEYTKEEIAQWKWSNEGEIMEKTK